MQPGSLAIASVRMKNAGTEFRAFFVGYSIQDAIGEWHNAPSDSVQLGPGEEAHSREFRTESLRYLVTRLSRLRLE